LKDEIKKKIKDEEDERMKLENKIAKIEKEEVKIIKLLRNEEDPDNLLQYTHDKNDGESFSKNLEYIYNNFKKQNQSPGKNHKTQNIV
jgi:hypothetical protein